jgi:hypothetical protein
MSIEQDTQMSSCRCIISHLRPCLSPGLHDFMRPGTQELYLDTNSRTVAANNIKIDSESIEIQSISLIVGHGIFELKKGISDHDCTTDTLKTYRRHYFSGEGSSSSSVFALAWRNYSPRSITPPSLYERFCVPLWLGANWGLA